jgi:hypothetical protein
MIKRHGRIVPGGSERPARTERVVDASCFDQRMEPVILYGCTCGVSPRFWTSRSFAGVAMSATRAGDQQPATSGFSSPFLSGTGDADRAAARRRVKDWATGLGSPPSSSFAKLFESRYPWLGIVVATAEASMVGALADWFAVTALFKHPLGIPIPHTAIIAARKDRVGITLGMFVQRNFLNRDVIAQRLTTLRPAERLAAARWSPTRCDRSRGRWPARRQRAPNVCAMRTSTT